MTAAHELLNVLSLMLGPNPSAIGKMLPWCDNAVTVPFAASTFTVSKDTPPPFRVLRSETSGPPRWGAWGVLAALSRVSKLDGDQSRPC